MFVDKLANEDYEVSFILLDKVDDHGHEDGYGANVEEAPEYIAAIEVVDEQVRAMVGAINS